ncbi:MAG: response regulator transcription factor [Chitinophagaceae bacterium]|jgi:DNA-binding response OmpR family regulator|nr:MAG: response regulator transcription factor [Chitinophagaceae bacterium]
MEKKSRILLVEDDLNLGFVITDNLEEAGYLVVHCPDGQTAWDHFQKKPFDLILLDIMLPKKDGFSLARQIRKKNEMIPLIFLTAKSLEEDKISGFEIGADDYITKPFSMKELLLRIEVFLRRTKALNADKNTHFNIGNLTFNYAELVLTLPDKSKVSLTQKEADLLKFLCENTNKTLRRDEILLHVWGKADYFLGRSMDVFITKLRKHFKEDPRVDLTTIHGVGFKFNVPEKAGQPAA